MRIKAQLTLLFALLFAAAVPDTCLGVAPEDVNFFKERPALLEASALRMDVDKSVRAPKRQFLGAFGIGGLNAFTLMGLCYPFNTYHNTTTYYYPFFGDSKIVLESGGKEVSFPKESIWYVRYASIAATREENDALAMFTVNFSPPESGAFVRIVVLKALADSPAAALFADVYGESKAEGGTLVQVRDEGVRTRTLTIGSLGAPGLVENGRLRVDVPPMKKGDENVFYFYYAIRTGENTGAPDVSRLKEKRDSLADETVAWWKKYLDGSARFVTPDARFNDMAEFLKIGQKIQRNANGAQVVVVKYADRSHDRENVHVSRFYLMMGMPDDAREIMTYGWLAAQKQGAILNSQAADLDVRNLPASTDWEHIPLDNDDPIRHVAERPSWTVLQFVRYYKATGDVDFIKKVYPYLRRNIVGQEITPDGLMPFHSDEMYQISYLTFVTNASIENYYSLDSSFAFCAAASGMEEIAGALGKPEDVKIFAGMRGRVEAAIEKYYWLAEGWFATAVDKKTLEPVKKMFPLISFQPAVIGLEKDPKEYELNLMNTIDDLGRKDGTVLMAKGAGLYHGQLMGMYLFNLKRWRNPFAAHMFDLLANKISDPAGTFSEVHLNTHAHASMGVDPSGLRKEDARRFGPWETALNIGSMVYYLTGMSVDAPKMSLKLIPEIPEGWKKWEFRDGLVGPDRFDLFVEDTGKKLIYRVVNKGPVPLAVSLELPIGTRTPVSLSINGAVRPPSEISILKAHDGNVITGIEDRVGKELVVEVEIK